MNTNADHPLCILLAGFFAIFQSMLDVMLGFVTLIGLEVPQVSEWFGSVFGCNV